MVEYKLGKYNTSGEELDFVHFMEKMATHQFNVAKKIDTEANINLYDIKYYEQRLHLMETLDEGEITIGNRI